MTKLFKEFNTIEKMSYPSKVEIAFSIFGFN